jgi:hypothetical protein
MPLPHRIENGGQPRSLSASFGLSVPAASPGSPAHLKAHRVGLKLARHLLKDDERFLVVDRHPQPTIPACLPAQSIGLQVRTQSNDSVASCTNLGKQKW